MPNCRLAEEADAVKRRFDEVSRGHFHYIYRKYIVLIRGRPHSANLKDHRMPITQKMVMDNAKGNEDYSLICGYTDMLRIQGSTPRM